MQGPPGPAGPRGSNGAPGNDGAKVRAVGPRGWDQCTQDAGHMPAQQWAKFVFASCLGPQIQDLGQVFQNGCELGPSGHLGLLGCHF